MTTPAPVEKTRSRNGGNTSGRGSLIQTATTETFDALILQGQGPIAVEFMSYGCGHCRAIEPLLEEAAERVKANEQVFRVNVAIETDLASRYQIAGTPTFVMFLEGQVVGRIEGSPPTLSDVVSSITQPFES